MNKTYKVVFNKVRGALMVANEATSSVQKKGTKTLVALAVMSIAASVGAADSAMQLTDQELNISGWNSPLGSLEGTQNHTNASVTNNTFTATNSAYGAAFNLYTATSNISNSTFANNQTTISLVSTSTASDSAEFMLGGVVMIKNGTTTFTDVDFDGNTISSTGEGYGALAAGGAIYEDAVINKADGTKPSALTIKVTRDMEYIGNNVTSATPDVYYGLWGSASTSAGGFLFLDRASHTTFDIAEGATLRIGDENSTGNMDSIATAVIVDGDTSKSSGFIKEGAGTLQINSELSKFYGTIVVNAGTLDITKDWTSMNSVDVADGATLSAGNVTLDKSVTNLTLNGEEFTEGDGKLIVTTGNIT